MRRFQEFIALIAIAFVIILIYICLESLFLLSKISYFSRLTLGEYIKVFLNSSLLLIIPILLFLSFICLICIILSRSEKLINLIKQLFIFLFSFSFVFLIFSHLDTFIYTTFPRINIAYLPLPIRIFIFLSLLIISFLFSKTYLISIFKFFCRKTKISITIFSITSILGAIFLFQNLKQYNNLDIKINRQSNEKLPNIILFSSDGLETERMSVYGAARDTTPNLREFAKSAIVFNQAFVNGDTTRSSIVSILTGKSPLTTKVFGDGEILTGKHSFEHLPAILKKLGYYCAIFGPDYSIFGPTATNMLDSFDEINGAKTYLSSHNFLLNKLIKTYPMEIYFLHGLYLRNIYYKLACLWGVINKFPVYSLGAGDRTVINRANRIIKQINRPIFIQIHLNSTHPHVFYGPSIPRVFSYGKKCIPDDNDCYDDALLYMDELFGKLLKVLIQSDKYNQTIILFLTDHIRHKSSGQIKSSLPLIIRFPNIGNIHNCDYPVQYLDIAPSILKAIDINIPDWMEGWPILYPLHNFTKEQINNRPIFSFAIKYFYSNREKNWCRTEVKPPLYGIREICMAIDRYILSLKLPTFISQLFVLEKVKFVRINNKGKRKEYLGALLEYLKNKGFILKR